MTELQRETDKFIITVNDFTISFSCVHAQTLQSCLTLSNPLARQAPLSMGFSRQEYWSGLSCSSPGDLANLGIEPESPAYPALQADSLLLSHQRSPYHSQKQISKKDLDIDDLNNEIKLDLLGVQRICDPKLENFVHMEYL